MGVSLQGRWKLSDLLPWWGTDQGESARSGRRGGENYKNQRVFVILWFALYVSLPIPSRVGENLTFKSTSVLSGLPWSGPENDTSMHITDE